MARYSTQGPQMAILAAVAAGVVGYFWGHTTGKGAAEDDIARLLRREEVSSTCRAEVNKASEATYWYEDAKKDAYRGYSRY